MAAGLTYRELRREVQALAREIGRDTSAHKQLAHALEEEARDTRRIAEQIAALGVDAATVAETHEVVRVLEDLGGTATTYTGVAYEASRAAQAAGQQAHTDHDGIQQAVDSSNVPMANSSWYTQE